MGPFAGTSFGIGTPSNYPGAQSPWGFSPYTSQPFGLSTPFQSGGLGGGPFGISSQHQPLQQIAQLLQIVPQQLQQLHVLQQQQLQYLQQLLQVVPAQLQQLQQLQQLIQSVPQQIQQLQQQAQPFGAGIGGFGLVPSPFAGQSAGHVM